MATYRFGQGVNVSAGKFNGLSEADEALMEVIQQGKSMTFDMPESDWDLIRQKNEEGCMSAPWNALEARPMHPMRLTPGRKWRRLTWGHRSLTR